MHSNEGGKDIKTETSMSKDGVISDEGTGFEWSFWTQQSVWFTWNNKKKPMLYFSVW